MKIKYIYSDDNSNEIVGRLQILTDLQGTESDINGLSSENDILSDLKNLKEDILLNEVLDKSFVKWYQTLSEDMAVSEILSHSLGAAFEKIVSDDISLTESLNFVLLFSISLLFITTFH